MRYLDDERLVLHTQAAANPIPGVKPCRPALPSIHHDGRRSRWHGFAEDDAWGIYGAKTGDIVVSISPAGREKWEVVALSPSGDAAPQDLVDAVVDIGLHPGPMLNESIEGWWLTENCRALGAAPPRTATLEELRSGLAALWDVDLDTLLGWSSYQPLPVVSRGWVRFRRAQPDAIPTGVALAHMITGRGDPGRGVTEVAGSGVLLSAWRRRIAGIDQGNYVERLAGLSTQVFFHVMRDIPELPTQMIWRDPAKLFSRLGWWYLERDPAPGLVHAPQVDVDWGRWAIRDPRRVELVPGAQMALDAGLDLTGAEGPDQIVVPDDEERRNVLAACEAAGIRSIGGHEPSEVVMVPRWMG